MARVRVLILGGGVAGCATALELADRGAAVTVVDRDQPGTGATGASAGILSPQYEAPGHGHAFRLQCESLALWPGFAERLEGLTGWRVGHRADGFLVANRSREEEDAAREALAWQHELGLEGEILTPGEARRVHSGVSLDLTSWVWLPREQQVDSQRLAVALADAVRGAGGTVLAGRPTAEILTGSGRVTGALLEDGTHLEADRVVVAGGAWSPLLRGLPRPLPVRPVRGQILRLLPEEPPPWPLLADHKGRYLVPRENRTLLVGSTMEEVDYDDGVTDAARAYLTEIAMELFPSLEGARVVERWAGLRPMTPDTQPVLGPDPALEGLVYATGFGRNGILLAPLAARAAAELALEGSSTVDWRPWSVERFG
ncbi:MAG: glycine oxidase ThiO [Longimicrobiales bacterium]|nr:glycine oxidase ThiO [Longimicrobiales bacterium]